MKRNKRSVSMLIVAVFMLVASILMASCDNPAEMPKELKSYFNEENAKQELKEEYRVNFQIDKSKTQISFSEDGKNLLIPPYQEAEKVFSYSKDEIKTLNSKSGDALWIRINTIINKEKLKLYPFQAAKMHDWNGCVLYVLYLADFINVYQTKCPEMINMDTAPEWFKQLLAERKANPSFAKSNEQLAIDALTTNVVNKNESATVEWQNSDLVKSIVIILYDDENDNLIEKQIIKDKNQSSLDFKNLKNLYSYWISIQFMDENGEPFYRNGRPKEWVQITPRSGDDKKDFVQSIKEFTEENSSKLLTSKYMLATSWKDSDKFKFSEDGKNILMPEYKAVESKLGYSNEQIDRIKENKMWGRLNSILNDKRPMAYWNVGAKIGNEEVNGNIRWVLCLVDFLNLYQTKCPDIVDLSKAPKWFTDLMARRKAEGKSLVKVEFK